MTIEQSLQDLCLAFERHSHAVEANTQAIRDASVMYGRINQPGKSIPSMPGTVGAAPSDIKKPDGKKAATAPEGTPKTVAAPSYAEVREAVTSMLEKRGPEAVVNLLAEFGVDHAKKLKEEQYGAFLAAARKG